MLRVGPTNTVPAKPLPSSSAMGAVALHVRNLPSYFWSYRDYARVTQNHPHSLPWHGGAVHLEHATGHRSCVANRAYRKA